MLDRKVLQALKDLRVQRQQLQARKAQLVLKDRKAHQLLEPKALKARRALKVLQALAVQQTSLFRPLVQQF
jgi:hypothetical protein